MHVLSIYFQFAVLVGENQDIHMKIPCPPSKPVCIITNAIHDETPHPWEPRVKSGKNRFGLTITYTFCDYGFDRVIVLAPLHGYINERRNTPLLVVTIGRCYRWRRTYVRTPCVSVLYSVYRTVPLHFFLCVYVLCIYVLLPYDYRCEGVADRTTLSSTFSEQG